MTLTRRRYSGKRVEVALDECPFCDHVFVENENRHDHLHEEHTPADAGLTPLGERSHADGPLFKTMPAVATDGGEARE